MKFIPFVLLIFIFQACGGGPDGPLSEAEIDVIEDKIIEAIHKGKITPYNDVILSSPISKHDFDALVPEDSTGRQDLTGFGFISQEELALSKGVFSNYNRDLIAVTLYAEMVKGHHLPAVTVDWKELKKALNVNERRRLTEFLVGHFQSQIEKYEAYVDKLRLEVINGLLFVHLKDGKMAAYENDNLANVKSPGELPNWQPHKVLQEVTDPEDPDEVIMQNVEVPISAADITHYQASYEDEDNIHAITMMYRENFNGFEISLPWIAMDVAEVESALKGPMFDFLLEHIAKSEEERNATIEEDTITVDTLPN